VGTDLAAFVARWRGVPAAFELRLDTDAPRTFEGILDGPYLGDDPGLGFLLGDRVILGDIAVGGTYISLETGAADLPAIVTDTYVELRMKRLPHPGLLDGGSSANWTSTLMGGRLARCTLTVAGPRSQ
jgi:hypothetical protein